MLKLGDITPYQRGDWWHWKVARRKVNPDLPPGPPLRGQCKTQEKSNAYAYIKSDVFPALRDGEMGPTKKVTVTVADGLEKWYGFRDLQKLGNATPKQVGKHLLLWCAEQYPAITNLSQINRANVTDFQVYLGTKYKHGNSNSLKMRWSSINGFFHWCVGKGWSAKNPIPDAKEFPQFKLRYVPDEVTPPTAKEVERVLDVAKDVNHRLWLYVCVLRYTGMAQVDAKKFSAGTGPSGNRNCKLDGNLVYGRRTKTNEAFALRIPGWLADALRALLMPEGMPFFPPVRIRQRAAEAGNQTYIGLMRQLFATAEVKMTPHKFRHFFITEQLSAPGMTVGAVSKMVGTSEAVIRKTYEHWVREGQDRRDEAQRNVWLTQGLDANGNPLTV